jgi:hypothetical protein
MWRADCWPELAQLFTLAPAARSFSTALIFSTEAAQTCTETHTSNNAKQTFPKKFLPTVTIQFLDLELPKHLFSLQQPSSPIAYHHQPILRPSTFLFFALVQFGPESRSKNCARFLKNVISTNQTEKQKKAKSVKTRGQNWHESTGVTYTTEVSETKTRNKDTCTVVH